MLKSARYYVKRLGWSVIPLRLQEKKPLVSWVEFQQRFPTDAELEQWFGNGTVNIGIVCGKISGNLVVVDLDTQEAVKLSEEKGFPPTARVSTGKGLHLYYTSKEEVRNFQARDDLPGIDLRGEGGFVVAPPSVHSSGKKYEWLVRPVNEENGIWPLPFLPECILHKTEGVDKKPLPELYEGVRQGERNNALTRLVGSWLANNETFESCLALAHDWNIQNQVPLPDKEVVATVSSIWQLHQKKKERDRVGRCETARLVLTPLSELFQEPEEQIDYVVDGLLPAGGFSVCAAKPKVGKSTLARCLALSVSRGEPFLVRPTYQGPVIYLALEEKRTEVKRHFLAMGALGSEAIYIHAARAPIDALTQLRVIAEEKKAILIIIDPLFRFTNIKDGNDYAMVTRALEPILALARESGSHVLCVHHMSKGERMGGDGLLGSTAIFGAVDTAIFLKRYEDYRTIYTCQRYGQDMEETILTFDNEKRIVCLGNEKSLEEETRVEEGIVSYLTYHPRGVTEKDICDNVEGRTQLLKKTLRKLVAAGSVERSGGGRKNDPYVYSRISSSGDSPPCAGTREPELYLPPSTNTQNSSSLVPNILKEPQNQYFKNGVTSCQIDQNTGSRDISENEVIALFPGTTILEIGNPGNQKEHSYANCTECPACDKNAMVCYSRSYFEGKSGKGINCKTAWEQCPYKQQA